jgi:tyrosyl-tRNA synthetase
MVKHYRAVAIGESFARRWPRSYSCRATSSTYFKELQERGFVYQYSHGLSPDSASCDIIHGVYLGLDPTASSLHVGHLLGLMAVLHAAKLGKTQ